MTSALPGLEVAETLGWTLEVTFVDGWSAALLLLGRVLVAGLLIVAVIRAVQVYGGFRRPRSLDVGALASAATYATLLAAAHRTADRAVVAGTAELHERLDAEAAAGQVTDQVVAELDRVQALFGNGDVIRSADAAAAAALQRSDTTELFFERTQSGTGRRWSGRSPSTATLPQMRWRPRPPRCATSRWLTIQRGRTCWPDEQRPTPPAVAAPVAHARRRSRPLTRTCQPRHPLQGSSYRLLTDDEQALHRSVSVLPGPFTLAAATAVADGYPARTAELLADLAHRSLLTPLGPREPGRPSRFAQLATVRGHGARALAGSDATSVHHTRRDQWMCIVGTAARPRLGTAQERAWFALLDDDLPTLRAVLQHTLVDEPSPTGVEIVTRMGMYWYASGALLEGRRWTELACRVTADVPPFAAAMVDLSLAAIWGFTGRGDLARGLSDRGLDRLPAELAPADELLLGDHLTTLAGCLWMSGDGQRARDVLDRVAGTLQRRADPTARSTRRSPLTGPEARWSSASIGRDAGEKALGVMDNCPPRAGCLPLISRDIIRL